ncbi:serine/threonine protein kinase [Bifidobacterium aesculapii]|uniref:serine/threonine protein kinase n=1 Tax=Bifidobacterium aesculapii TaxID=1329411 RepID=UPI000AF48189|nr:serine/threonine-protein kinase [Bifidobacterium aesculapii]
MDAHSDDARAENPRMDDNQTLHAMGLDDAYHVERTLADGPAGVTELVTLDGAGPLVRKKIPLRLARRRLWSTLADCRSPRLPRVEAAYELPDRFVVVHDYVPGVTLDRYVASRGRLAAGEAVRIALQVCDAVGELHAHGIIHRDVTPTNVVIAADGAHLIDFGIARERSAAGAARARDTTTLGTWGYAAPEQYGFAPTDARTDVYAVGRLLGFMLTGTHPSDTSRYDRSIADPDVTPPPLRTVIARACAFEPSARMQTIRELRHALEQCGADRRPAPPQTRLRNSGRTTEPDGTARTVSDGPHPHPHPRTRGTARILAWVASGLVMLLIAAGVGYAAVRAHSGGVTPRTTVSSPSRRSSGDSGSDGTDADGTGSTDGTQTGGGAPTVEHNPIELVESGWSAESGYVEYALALRNTDTTKTVRFPKVTITGRDAGGSVMFADTAVFAPVFPGETAYFAGQTGDGDKPADVAFTVETPSADDLIDTDGVESYAIRGARERRTDLDGVTFSGEVITERDDDNGAGVYADDVTVTLVLRDKTGRIVFGRNENVAKPAVGQARAFSIQTYGLPAYASYELHAHAS